VQPDQFHVACVSSLHAGRAASPRQQIRNKKALTSYRRGDIKILDRAGLEAISCEYHQTENPGMTRISWQKPPMAKSLIKRRDSYHPNPPIGAEVRMTNLDNNGTAKVRINDRDPMSRIASLMFPVQLLKSLI